MGAKTIRPNREPVVDVEGGTISARDVKAAREVAEEVMTEREFHRLANRIADRARDEDRSLTRGARDRDRATPRDVSHVESERLRGDLPARGGGRERDTVARGAFFGLELRQASLAQLDRASDFYSSQSKIQSP